MSSNRKYQFRWDLIGDIQAGRPNLGSSTRLEVYRLMQFTFRDVVEQRYGTQAADEVFRDAGKIAGRFFYENILGKTKDLDEFVKTLQDVLVELKIGILRVEEVDIPNGHLVLTISEDLDCSGLPELDFEFCAYDEGFISGLLESYSGRPFEVHEIDCWCTGDRTCRFRAEAVA